MTNTEIKKNLYREKPNAHFKYIRKGIAYYYADLSEQRVYFEIPVNDMGDADFTSEMDAKLLGRWLINN